MTSCGEGARMKSFVSIARIWIIVTCGSLSVGTVHQNRNTLHCNPEKQYEMNGRCCSKCQPGTYMIAICTYVANTSCSPCGPNEYMSVWNDDSKCTLHMLCDPGKALHVFNSGNSTHPRECVCTDGYHFDTKQEICMENENCSPGFGVQSPVQRNKNTVCVPCSGGYYSNSSSATDLCQPWTNCSEAGQEEIVPGTSVSDAVCGRNLLVRDFTQVIVIITLLILTSVIILCIYFVCCTNKYSLLKETVQVWVNGKCDQLRRSEEKTSYCEVKLEPQDTNFLQILHLPVGELTYPIYSNDIRESEVPCGRMSPAEDEYVDQRLKSNPENESMVTGVDSSSDLDVVSLETFPGFSDTSSDRLLSPSQEEWIDNPPYSHHCCGQSAKAIPRKCPEENFTSTDPMDNLCGHCASHHTCNLFSQSADHNSQRHFGEDPCFTDSKNTRSRNSAGSSPTTGTPSPTSGNITGNNNTTVFSSAPVMNIKTDVVVVYYNPSPKDTHTSPENEENMTQPMQEESCDSRCDSFVANTQSQRYTDTQSCKASDSKSKTAADQPGDHSSPVILSQEQCGIMFCQNTDFIPVQEEGKPEYYYSEIV